MRAAAFASVLLLVACGNAPEPAAPVASSAPPASVTPPASATPTPSSTAGDAPEPPRRKRPLAIHNSCSEVVTLAFGEDPKTAGKRTLAEDGSIDGPRDDKGNMTVWLLDAKGEPIVQVNVTRGMKKVEVGRSCRTLDAR
jgi:hypothetical protein